MSATGATNPQIRKSAATMSVLRALTIYERLLPLDNAPYRAVAAVLSQLPDEALEIHREETRKRVDLMIAAHKALGSPSGGQVMAAINVLDALIDLLSFEADPAHRFASINRGIALARDAIQGFK